MINLIIDNRESKIIEILNGQDGILFTSENLDVGDFVFKDEEGTVILIIERKTVLDLKASICDGRSREQKARLLNCGVDKDRILFLIEGNLNKSLEDKISNIGVSSLLGSIINTQLRDNVKVYKTTHINETVNFIKRLHQKLNNDLDIFFKQKSSINETEYSCTLKKKKKENITPNVWFINQLSLIPQVTEIIASKIIEKYPTLKILVLSYENIDEKERPNMLSEIKIQLKNGKERRIGKKISEKIFNMIYGKT